MKLSASGQPEAREWLAVDDQFEFADRLPPTANLRGGTGRGCLVPRPVRYRQTSEHEKDNMCALGVESLHR